MSQLSHSGFERSSCWETIRLVSWKSCSSLPGAGSAEWRTWYSRLNVGSSVHSGRPDSSGGVRQPLAVARHEVQPAADMGEVVIELRRRPIEDQHRADVHVRRLSLLVKERRVGRRQAVEMLLSHTWSVPNSL